MKVLNANFEVGVKILALDVFYRPCVWVHGDFWCDFMCMKSFLLLPSVNCVQLLVR